MTDKIKKDMVIGDIIRKYPDTAVIMMQYGLHCVGCMVAALESIEEGCKAHGMEDKSIDELIKMMNEYIEKETSGKKDSGKK